MTAHGDLPPAGFACSDLDLCEVPAGEVWRRLYLSIYTDPLGFAYGLSRFSDPRTDRPETERFGVVYLGSSLKVCFLEAVLRDRRNGHLGEFPIPYAELQSWTCTEIEPTTPLTLVDLRGDGPIRMGMPTDAVRASGHRLGQAWSLAFWSHRLAPDGILYPSRLNEESNIALFDRALPKVNASVVRPLLEYRAEMAQGIRDLRLAIL